jgi:hypothetical protein
MICIICIIKRHCSCFHGYSNIYLSPYLLTHLPAVSFCDNEKNSRSDGNPVFGEQHTYFLVVGTKVSYKIYLSKLRPICYILSIKCR